MSKHIRSETYLRLGAASRGPGPMQPRKTLPVVVAEEPARFKNAGRPTSPIECAKLDDAGSTTRNILRSILRTLEKK